VFRLSGSGHIQLIAAVDADILKGGVLLAIDKVNRRRHIQVLDADSGRRMPHADQLLRMVVRQRLQENAFNHAENDRVRAHSDSKRDQGDRGEKARPGEPARNLPELIVEDCHLLSLRA
jgi:hypothetical protein